MISFYCLRDASGPNKICHGHVRRKKGKQIQSMMHLLHDILVYPPKMYFPTRIIVTVGPLLSHNEWKVVLAQPSADARQQRFQ